MSGVFHAVKTWPGYHFGKDVLGAGIGYAENGWMGAIQGYETASQIGNGPSPKPPGPLAPPSQDTAANSAAQQAALLRRRRGVLGSIYAGANAAQPTVASKSLLGS